MIRTQIQLTERQARQLRDTARRQGISLAETIRRCVDKAMASSPADSGELYARAATLLGAFRDPEAATDMAANHDAYLEGAYR